MATFFRPGATRDPIYSTLRDGAEDNHVRGREYLEHIWQEVAPYVDPDAAHKATRDLAAVFWELQLAYALKSGGKSLVPRDRLAYRNNRGPDLFTENPSVWLEAVVVRCGTGSDAIRRPEVNKVYNSDPDGLVLRLRSVIKDKSTKFQEYIADGIVKKGQATVIAISGVALPWSHRRTGSMPPEIVRAVYPANNPVIEINRKTAAISGQSIEYRDRVQKKTGAEVKTDVFLDAEFKHVSAVLYGDSDWVDIPNPQGADFKIVHNSTAVTALPDGWFPAGCEYWWRAGGRLECCRRA